MTNVTVTDQGSGRQMSIPRADVSLSLYQLLLGRVVLRTVTVDELKLTVYRAGRRRAQLDLGNFGDTGAAISHRARRRRSPTAGEPGATRGQRPQSTRSWFAQLRAVHVRTRILRWWIGSLG